MQAQEEKTSGLLLPKDSEIQSCSISVFCNGCDALDLLPFPSFFSVFLLATSSC